MSEPRYAYDREQGFIVDMGRPRHDNPHLEWALTNSEVVRLLNDLEAKLSKMEEALHGISSSMYDRGEMQAMAAEALAGGEEA